MANESIKLLTPGEISIDKTPKEIDPLNLQVVQAFKGLIVSCICYNPEDSAFYVSEDVLQEALFKKDPLAVRMLQQQGFFSLTQIRQPPKVWSFPKESVTLINHKINIEEMQRRLK